MDDIALLIDDIVGLNEQVIGIVVPVFIIYLILFWLLVSVWVYFDARKRYESILIAFLFALINFFPPFNFLILIFYLVIRPEIRYDDFDDWEAGGVNVPIVNFMGKEGIEMSFEMRIHPKKLRDSQKSNDMSVEIGWDKQDERFRLIDRDELAKQVLGDEYDFEDKDGEGEVQNVFSQIAGRVKKQVGFFRDKITPTDSDMSEKDKDDKKEKKDDKKDEKEGEDVDSEKDKKENNNQENDNHEGENHEGSESNNDNGENHENNEHDEHKNQS